MNLAYPSSGFSLSQTLDLEQYYTGNDVALLANKIMMDLAFLTMNWKHMLGRPVYTIIASSRMIGTLICVGIILLTITFCVFYFFRQ